MGNGKIEYYTDFDCTEHCKKLQVSGIKNIYSVELEYKSKSNGRIIKFRMPYGEFSLAFKRYEFELDYLENNARVPFGFVPYVFVLSIETYSNGNMIHKDVIMSNKTCRKEF